MQASVWLHCSFVTLNSYIKSPQKFVLCYLSVACSQFLACFTVQFSRCRSSDLFQDQIEMLFAEHFNLSLIKMVGLNGLEPSTSRLSGGRSNLLSYKPVFNEVSVVVLVLYPLVEIIGIEPMTPCLQGRCSPS